jgi:hypothetical protein
LLLRADHGFRSLQNVFDNVTVRRTRGYCYDSFHIEQADIQTEWNKFLSFAWTKDVSDAWSESFRSLLISDSLGSEMIPSFDGDRWFRIFVSRKTYFYGGAEEYYVYVVPERNAEASLRSSYRPFNLPSNKAGRKINDLPIRTTTEAPKAVETHSEAPPDQLLRLFISYKHGNNEIVDEIRKWLGWLEISNKIIVFDDRSIKAGQEWDKKRN